MVTFLDGPAAGQSLHLARTPILLRVTHDPQADRWDALDQLEDQPTESERIYVYELATEPSRVFVDYRDGRGRRGMSMLHASYRLVRSCPPPTEMQARHGWFEWCTEVRDVVLHARDASRASGGAA